MFRSILPAIILSLFMMEGLNAQGPKLRLEMTTVEVEDDIAETLSSEKSIDEAFQGKVHAYLTFDRIPKASERDEMGAKGLSFLDYLPDNTYMVSFKKGSDLSFLQKYDARSLYKAKAEYKVSQRLQERPLPSHAVNGDRVSVIVEVYRDVSVPEAVSDLQKTPEVQVNGKNARSKTIELSIPQNAIMKVGSKPYLMYMEPVHPKPTPDDREGRSLHRSNAINTQFQAGRSFDGSGVVVAIADDGGIGPHIDFEGRHTDHTGGLGGDHGDMTAGICVGAGNLDPTIQGMASGSHLHMYDISGYPHVVNAPSNLNNLGTVITSTSYSQGCNEYTTDTRDGDQMIRQNPSLIHVFSAGNSASSDCGYGATGFGNITGGYKQGKNVIATGNLDNEDNLANSSSRGPAEDGRIKPDICANGQGQLSTDEGNTYQTGGGTSAASPGIGGVIAQLYEAYKSMNSGNNPESPLIKAALLNTAEDLGNPGPDFYHGWGRVNALRAIRVLEDGRYMSSTVGQSGSNTHNITVPSNVSQLRVMVYWLDYEGSPTASKALVNDLNMQVTDPSSTTYNPWVLDHDPNVNTLDDPAIRAIDSINNVEQVTIDNPASGTYTVDVDGYQVPQGPQKYYVLYEFMTDSVELTYPIGGEGLVPGTTEKIRWDAYGNTTTFDLEYSVDSGNTWNPIASGVNADLRTYDWTVPTALTGKVFVRVTRGTMSDKSDAPLSIIGVPQNLQVTKACPDSVTLTWNSVTGATGYEVYELGNKYMDSVGFTNNTTITLSPYDPSVEHWFSVSAHGPENAEGRRANAINQPAGTMNCNLPYDVEAKLSAPTSGTMPDCQGTNSMDVDLWLINHGTNSISNIPVAYELNGGTPVNETYSNSIPAGDSALYTFSSQISLNSGNNTLVAWADHSSDGNQYNDTSEANVTVTSGTTASLPFYEDFESFANCGTSMDCEATNCALGNGLVNETNLSQDDIDWRVDDGGTPSNNTGPSTDFDPGTTTGNYVYLEASNGCEGKVANMITPCFDLSNAVSPKLEFAYHMDGASMGDLHVDVLSNGSWDLDVMTPIYGDQGSNWNTRTVDLGAYVGENIVIRFRGITGDGYTSDVSLDAINVKDDASKPVPDFEADKRMVCTGDVVSLTDLSTNNPTSWNWDINPPNASYVNGTSSSSQNPQVTFAYMGTYEVQLTATNSVGSDSITKTSYIHVGETANSPFTEDFEGTPAIPSTWMVVDPGGSYTWTEAVGILGPDGGSTDAAFIENFNYNNTGAEDELVTEVIFTDWAKSLRLTFDVSYTQYSDNYSDTLRIEVSDDCGDTYTTVYNKGGSNLATVPDQTNFWEPNDTTDWREETVDLSSYSSPRTRVRFINVNGWGNNLYLDNINIQGSNTSIQEKEEEQVGLTVIPNPTRNSSLIRGEGFKDGEVTVDVRDISGRVVLSSSAMVQNGKFQQRVDLSDLGSGMYFLETRNQDQKVVEKIIVQD